MTNSNANDGRFVWYEHLSNDTKATIEFYSAVVGWTTQPFGQDGDYEMWVGSQGPLGGVMKLPDEARKTGTPPNWMAHVQVENVDESASRAAKLGGKVLKAPEDIPTVGRFAVVADPQGAVLSIFTAQSPMTLHDTSKPGEFCWNELLTSDNVAAFDFYSQMFGWKLIQDMDMGPMGTYRVFGLGEKQLGGMMMLPKGAPTPPMWIYYAEVPDLDAALARAKAQNAKLMNGPMEVPGGGRIAQLMDPQGAAFALHQAAKQEVQR